MERKQFSLGDVVMMKKSHPCGANEWQIIRMGADIRMKCVKCDRSVMIPRSQFERQMRKVIRQADPGKMDIL
ncbi:DUF951 domain-containing protein [Effusibacillus dendaii]|uniref:DUF951 domain-containing protein n=1 Tax=Effusibacillus dendaii TaxID=2743772 RepID=A0A7I8DBF1_9BACL|nr:DUF951 domain-containing protein [Effusibacillus dendaii]BCJ87498.1 hypothetical protein skT53_24830 [Effusibacillus dendaii]